MKIKSGVWAWLTAACGCVGLLYSMGLEGNTQVGAAVTGEQAATALVLILLALAFLRLHFAAKDREEREKRRVHRSQKNTVQAGKRKAG